jgi:hypothetical protein
MQPKYSLHITDSRWCSLYILETTYINQYREEQKEQHDRVNDASRSGQ